MLWKRGCVLGLQVCDLGLGLGLEGCGLCLGLAGCGLVNITDFVQVILYHLPAVYNIQFSF